MGKAAAKQKTACAEVSIQELDLRRTKITLVGSSELICHRFGGASISKIRDKQQKLAVGGREAKNPEQDFLESLYVVTEAKGSKPAVFGFPATAFKSAAVAACRHITFMTMTAAKGAFHVDGAAGVHGTLVPIRTRTGPVMRETVCRVGQAGAADLRYRGHFPDWEVELDIEFNAEAISLEQLVQLFEVAGFSIGIGEHRPSSPKKTGPHGRWHVKRG